jgi:hypothetical protein
MECLPFNSPQWSTSDPVVGALTLTEYEFRVSNPGTVSDVKIPVLL